MSINSHLAFCYSNLKSGLTLLNLILFYFWNETSWNSRMVPFNGLGSTWLILLKHDARGLCSTSLWSLHYDAYGLCLTSRGSSMTLVGLVYLLHGPVWLAWTLFVCSMLQPVQLCTLSWIQPCTLSSRLLDSALYFVLDSALYFVS